MKKIILQHAVGDQVPILNLVKSKNSSYAEATGFEYYSDETIRCPERPYYWEKIALLKQKLSEMDDGDLVVWEDADSLNIGTDSFETAMPSNNIFGMTQNRAGLNGSQLLPWFNSGVMVIINCPEIRDFFDRVWARNDRNDEISIVAEWQSSASVKIFPIDPKWNCWLNNKHVCPNPVVKTFHGIRLEDKLAAIQSVIGVETSKKVKIKKKKVTK